MDNICHSLVGAALSETGLGKRSRYAAAALVIGANFPDLDVVAAFTEHGLGFRRGITHGLPAMVVLPFVLTALLLLWQRAFGGRRAAAPGPDRQGATRPAVPARLLALSALAIWTHPVLDWMNVYGMRWLMPFDGTWFYGDSLFIVDPWLWALLGAGWIAGRRLRRRGDPVRGERIARALVAAAVAYVALMVGLTGAARSAAAAELGLADAGPRRLMVAPPFFASWRRQVTFDAGDGYRYGEVAWGARPALRLGPDTTAKRLELLAEVPRSAALEDLLDWARFPFAVREGNLIRVDDARYARGGRSFAGITIPAPGGR